MKVIRDFQQARRALTRPAAGDVVLPPQVKKRIKQAFGEELSAGEAVARIVTAVREQGDQAVRHYTSLLDGAKLSRIEVSEEEIELAHETVDPELALALVQAAERIRHFHEKCLSRGPHGLSINGVGRFVRSIDRVGIYAPGGAAAYPSTVLMTVVPARVAGVSEVVLATPPSPDGSASPATLVAADIAGVDRIFKMGGAQAIAALAFGTATVPRVDKVCGPGNIFVLLAKKMVYGTVDIDGLAGPSEVMVLADGKASAELCAAELLAQAEHDPMASAILVTTSEAVADEVNRAISRRLPEMERRDIIEESLDSQGKIIVVSHNEAIELANLYAPEHLLLLVEEPHGWVESIRHAGAIFVNTPVSLGDYILGPSHVLPTGGSARYASPLSVEDFLKTTTLVKPPIPGLKKLAATAEIIARAEGLSAHARSMKLFAGMKRRNQENPPCSPFSKGGKDGER